LDASGEGAALRQRHLAQYLAFLEQAHPHLFRPERAPWNARVWRELANVRAARRWAMQAGQPESALRMAIILWVYLLHRGLIVELIEWLQEGLAAAAPDSAVRGLAMALLGGQLTLRGQYAPGIGWAERGVALLRALRERGVDCRVELGEALHLLGWTLTYAPADDAADGAYLEAVALLDQPDDAWSAGLALMNHGELRRWRGDALGAERLEVEALRRFSPIGEEAESAVAGGILGYLALGRGDVASAAARARESLRLLRSAGTTFYLPEALVLLGCAESARGRWESAARLFGAAEAARALVGVHVPPPNRAAYQHAHDTSRRALGEEAFDAAWAGGNALSTEQALDEALARGATPRPPGAGKLTAREAEVLRLVAVGKSNREIGEALVISPKTVGRHLENIYAKLGVDSRAAAAALASRQGRT